MSKSRLALTLLTLAVFAAGLGIFNVHTSDAQVRPDPEARNRRLLPILGLQGVVFTDYDETRGRLVIGVENRNYLYYAVQAQLKSLGVASDEVDVVETKPIYNLATLRDQQRPLAGGLQIRFDNFYCTLGFNAVRNGRERICHQLALQHQPGRRRQHAVLPAAGPGQQPVYRH
jgi:hypothetical protein